MLGTLEPVQIREDGRIAEWFSPEKTEVQPGHRHISHLFALYPGSQITVRTPKAMQAARKTLEFRLDNGGGHTGWSRAWIIHFWARLLDGKQAGEHVKLLLEKYHIVVSGWDVADVFGVIKSKDYIISTFDGFRVDFSWNGPARIFLQNCLTPTPFTDFEDAKIEFYSGTHRYNVNIMRDDVRNHAIFKSGTTHDVTFQKGSSCIETSEEGILKATPFSKFDDDEAWAADRETYLSKIEDTQNIQDEFEDMFSF